MNNIPTKIVKSVVKDIRKYCDDYACTLVFDHKNKYLDNESKCEASAYFSIDPKLLIKVSTFERTPNEWLANLLHETCHLDQWFEGSPEWEACYIDDIDIDALANLWIDGKIEFNTAQKYNIFRALYNIEKDAEQRAIKKIVEYGLDEWINLSRYAQEAHCYINEYVVTALCRKWIPASKPSYKIEEIVKDQPTDLVGFQILDVDWMDKYRKHYPELFKGNL